MSVSRKVQRQQAREAARATAAKEKPKRPAAGPGASERATQVAALRRRMRLVLLTTTLGGLLLMRVFNAELTLFLQNNGIWGRVALMLALLAPALFTLLLGLGQLRDRSSSA